MFGLFSFGKKKSPVAEGKRLNLRPVAARDYRVLLTWFQDIELMEYAFGLTVEHDVINRIAMEYYHDLMTSPHNAYSIETKGGLLIGFIRFTVRTEGDHYGRIGILIGERNFWGKGYGTEALKLALEVLFTEKKLGYIELDTAQFNSRAQRCFEKCGFRKMGELTEVNFLTGEVAHKVWMKITREEFYAPRSGDLKAP
ncbi:MAG: GNAT family N-acetyltransferase [Candidatus Eremiobacteraeota bacterium]|nr:GNAT family N-acetyltransferase [Candidatus Eremiobacteraeota bacterium]